ncbi:hypothetical protein MPSEU_000667500 [Mayamaea pseudoterrestris]|nr:hypothetical protein MPSEU_000667500 [Mayamaea pseudoterrestris]
MPDIFLIVVMAVALIILLIASVYLLVYYSHPDDKNDAYLPKLVVILGFILAGATVLLFPLDVANNEGYAGCQGYDTSLCGGLNMVLLWSIVFWAIPIFCFIIVPFMTFYYEADDGMIMAGTSVNPTGIRKSRLAEACCYQFFVILIVGVFFGVLYAVLNDAKIPVQNYQTNAANVNGLTLYEIAPNVTTNATFNVDAMSNMTANDASWVGTLKTSKETLTLSVSVATFYGGLMAWIGWFLFALFGGIGLAATPLDFYLIFRDRPKHMDAQAFAEAQQSLRQRVNELVEIGELIKTERHDRAHAGMSKLSRFSLNGNKRALAKEEREAVLQFKQAVYLLEEDVDDFKDATSNYENSNALWPYIALLLGFVSFIISIFWFIHVIVYVYPDPPLAPFLNAYFKWFDQWFPLFGVLSVAIFTVYLLFAAVKGCFKFGIRFMFFQIHPMKINKTYMSSFLFNIGLVLLCALPVVQFCQDAFADYAAFSNIRQMFGVQVQNLGFIGWFYRKQIFIYIFMAFAVITTLYLCCKPRDKSADSLALRDRLKRRVTAGPGSA